MTAKKCESEADGTSWQASFVNLLPMIEKLAAAALRHLKAEAKQDAVGEVVASAMCAYQRLHERGELQRAFASALARYAIARYHDGRRVGTSQCSRDAYSSRAKRKAGFEIQSLATLVDVDSEENLIDKRQTPVLDQVAFRIDFPRWLRMQGPRNCRIAECLMQGYSTSEVATEFDVSAARISQLRRKLADAWFAFNCATMAQGGRGGKTAH